MRHLPEDENRTLPIVVVLNERKLLIVVFYWKYFYLFNHLVITMIFRHHFLRVKHFASTTKIRKYFVDFLFKNIWQVPRAGFLFLSACSWNRFCVKNEVWSVSNTSFTEKKLFLTSYKIISHYKSPVWRNPLPLANP